jgi:hypothetical protein
VPEDAAAWRVVRKPGRNPRVQPRARATHRGGRMRDERESRSEEVVSPVTRCGRRGHRRGSDAQRDGQRTEPTASRNALGKDPLGEIVRARAVLSVPQQRGQKPRPLPDSPVTRTGPQPSHSNRAQPAARRPQSRKLVSSSITKPGSGAPSRSRSARKSARCGRTMVCSAPRSGSRRLVSSRHAAWSVRSSASGTAAYRWSVIEVAPRARRRTFDAARFINRSGLDLVPEPLAIFEGGELAGQGLLDALRAGEDAFVPCALDHSTYVASETDQNR